MRNELIENFRKNGYECYISTRSDRIVYVAFQNYLSSLPDLDVDEFTLVDKRVFVSENDDVLVELLKLSAIDNSYRKVEEMLKEKGFREILS